MFLRFIVGVLSLSEVTQSQLTLLADQKILGLQVSMYYPSDV